MPNNFYDYQPAESPSDTSRKSWLRLPSRGFLAGVACTLVFADVHYNDSQNISNVQDNIADGISYAKDIYEDPALPGSFPDTGSTQTKTDLAIAGPGSFLEAEGSKLIYGDSETILKGANFDNVSAIGTYDGAGTTDNIATHELDYQTLSKLGGNHVRFGMSTKWFVDDPENAFDVLDQNIAWARDNDVFISLVFFHPYPGNVTENYGNSNHEFWSSEEHQQEMQQMWLDIAVRYKDEPALAGYDLLNEPTPSSGDCNDWFDLAQEYRDAIYEVDQNHLVFIEACKEGLFWKIFDGDNIVYETHFYAPQHFSHSNEDPDKRYPGEATDWDGKTRFYDKDAFLHSDDPVLNLSLRSSHKWAQDNNVPFYSGEWGAQSNYEGADQYVTDIAEIYQELGINHAFYTWRHWDTPNTRFGIYEYEEEDLRVLFPEKLAAFKISVSGAVKPQF